MFGGGMGSKRAASIAAGLAAVCGVGLAWTVRKYLQTRAELDKCRQNRAQERQGRIHAEKSWREALMVQQKDLGGHLLRPIAHLKSCFHHCRSTPRQGRLAPSTRAVVKLEDGVSPTSIEGLESYTHAWLIYIFHTNTNLGKQERAHRAVATARKKQERFDAEDADGEDGSDAAAGAGGDGDADADAGDGDGAGAGASKSKGKGRGKSKRKKQPKSSNFTFISKVAPPALKGKKVGVFATRTPHRPNSIGLLCVRIESVNCAKKEVVISGIDCIEGTPVLDLKPYLPYSDSVPDAVIPDWVYYAGFELIDVTVLDAAREQLHDLMHLCKLYADEETVLKAVTEVLTVNIRNPYHQGGLAARGIGQERDIWFDHLRFVYTPDPEDRFKVTIVRVEKLQEADLAPLAAV